MAKLWSTSRQLRKIVRHGKGEGPCRRSLHRLLNNHKRNPKIIPRWTSPCSVKLVSSKRNQNDGPFEAPPSVRVHGADSLRRTRKRLRLHGPSPRPFGGDQRNESHDGSGRYPERDSCAKGGRVKHVVEVYDIILDADNAVTAVVLEYVAGDDLTEYAEALEEDSEYLKTLYQIASGIADMHQCGKIHRDIKPNNMKHDAEGIVKIFDFGLCKDDDTNASTMHGRGTDGYRAPELYAAPPAPYTKAVDTYAFGVLSWWLLEGELPQELWDRPPQENAQVPSISTSSTSLPTEIVEIIDSTLRVNPEARPSMANVRDVLAQRLLFGRHRAHLSTGQHEYDLDTPGQGVTINIAGTGSIVIRYDGLRFVVASVSGKVFVNNSMVTAGRVLPGSSVITIGATSLGPRRTFVTFDISHPEVVL